MVVAHALSTNRHEDHPQSILSRELTVLQCSSQLLIGCVGARSPIGIEPTSLNEVLAARGQQGSSGVFVTAEFSSDDGAHHLRLLPFPTQHARIPSVALDALERLSGPTLDVFRVGGIVPPSPCEVLTLGSGPNVRQLVQSVVASLG